MEMSFPDYIDNPSGSKNGVWTHRTMYKDMYNQKLTKILVRETGKIKYQQYVYKDNYIVHFKIPSEVIPDFYYDTVIEFSPVDQMMINSNNLKRYNVKFYSNDPAFVFTFAYSFLQNDMFIRDLVPRMSKEAVKKAAVQTNPKNEVGYVKSIYFTYILMDKYNLWNAQDYKQYGKIYSKSSFLKEITHADEKVKDRTDQQEKINKEKKIDKEKLKNRSKSNPKNVTSSNNVTTSNNIKNNSKSKNVSTIKNIGKSKGNVNFNKF